MLAHNIAASKTMLDQSQKCRLITNYYLFLLLGLRPNDLLIVPGIKPLVLLCLGFLNKMPRNTISEMQIRVSIIVRLLQILNKKPSFKGYLPPHVHIYVSSQLNLKRACLGMIFKLLAKQSHQEPITLRKVCLSNE